MRLAHTFVIPAKAGIQYSAGSQDRNLKQLGTETTFLCGNGIGTEWHFWIPAFAGMTDKLLSVHE